MKNAKMLLGMVIGISLSYMMQIRAESIDKKHLESHLFDVLCGTCHMVSPTGFNKIKNKTLDVFTGSSLIIKEQSEVLNKIDISGAQSKKHPNCKGLVAEILMLRGDYKWAVENGHGDLTMLQLMQKIESLDEKKD